MTVHDTTASEQLVLGSLDQLAPVEPQLSGGYVHLEQYPMMITDVIMKRKKIR